MRFGAAILATAMLSACGPTPHDSLEGPSVPPADAPAEALAQADAALFEGDLRLIGTEPFWGLKITSKAITLTRPDTPDLVVANPGPKSVNAGAVWRAPDLEITLTETPCSDGMSDRTYPLSARVMTAGATLRGCAAPESTFGRDLP